MGHPFSRCYGAPELVVGSRRRSFGVCGRLRRIGRGGLFVGIFIGRFVSLIVGLFVCLFLLYAEGFADVARGSAERVGGVAITLMECVAGGVVGD